MSLTDSFIDKKFEFNFKYNIPFVIGGLLKWLLFVFTIVTMLVYSNYIVWYDIKNPATKWALKHNPEFLILFWIVTFIYHNILNHIITKFKKPFITFESIEWIILLVFVNGFLFYKYPNPFSLLFISFSLMIIIRFYDKKANWFKKYEFYKNKLGSIDDLMSNSEFVFHYELLTPSQISELLVIKNDYVINGLDEESSFLYRDKYAIDDWEASALCYLSRKNPSLFFDTIDKLNISPNWYYESGFNKPFMRVLKNDAYLIRKFLEVYINKKIATYNFPIDSLIHINWDILIESPEFDDPYHSEIVFVVGLHKIRRGIPLSKSRVDVLLCRVIKKYTTEVVLKLPFLLKMGRQNINDAFNIGLASYTSDPFSRGKWVISVEQIYNPQIFNAYKSWLVHWITRNAEDFWKLPKYITQNKNCLDIYNTISSSK